MFGAIAGAVPASLLSCQIIRPAIDLSSKSDG
jgi:hypothetical protein